MDEYRATVEILHPLHAPDRRRAEEFLLARGLSPERDIDLTVLVSYDGKPAATASLAVDVVKEVAVDPSLEGEGLAALAVSRILSEAAARGRHLLRVYTAPKNLATFASFGFALLARSGDDAVLMESDPRAFGRWAARARGELGLAEPASPAAGAAPGLYPVGAAVVNCNPFTRGHRSLIERAAARCGALLVFVVQSDKSSFPADVRLRLVREGAADLPNVRVLPSGPYVISEATFPTYFLKEKSRATEIHARLDLTLFAEKICPAFGVGARFVGTEPYCAVTSLYNSLMAEVLPPRGVDFVELPRKEEAGAAISASSVRAAIRDDDWGLLESLVPSTTMEYLRSPEAAPVLERIRSGKTRH
jgi:[citrate (pro-3S)-lyase] ligase